MIETEGTSPWGLLVKGPAVLSGSVSIQGSKNIAQKVIPLSVRWPGNYRFHNVPRIEDSRILLRIVEHLGGTVDYEGEDVLIDTRQLEARPIGPELARQSTGTFLFTGALLGRFGHALVAAPGGDRIGYRPISYHLEAFEALGYRVAGGPEGYEIATASDRMATNIGLRGRTVNGTVNAMLAATGTADSICIENAAVESDILEVCDCLRALGCDVTVQRDTITLRAGGVKDPTVLVFDVASDRNDTATFALFAGACASRLGVTLRHPCRTGMDQLWSVLESTGATVQHGEDQVVISRSKEAFRPLEQLEGTTGHGFSTDWGPMAVSLLIQCPGLHTYYDRVFTNRFAYVQGLMAMGLDVDIHTPDGWRKGDSYALSLAVDGCRFDGGQKIKGETVIGNDIRGAAGLVLAGLIASGETVIADGANIERGYADFAERLSALGAEINWIDMGDHRLPGYRLRG